MHTINKQSLSNKHAPMILFFSCVLSGVICFMLGEIALPLPIATLAALYLFDNSNRRIFSIVSSILLIALNIVGLVLELSFSTFGPAAVILALLIYFSFTREQAKSDASFLMTLVCALFSLASCALMAMIIQKNYSWDAVISFYSDLTDMLRDNFFALMHDAYTTAGISIDGEALAELFNSQINMVISYLLIGAFFIVGVSMKLFGFIVKKYSADQEKIKSWRFFTSNLYAYFYVILVFASMFMASLNNVLSVAVLNLYNIFMVVYAYVGCNVAISVLKIRFKPLTSYLLLAVSLLLFASLAVQILAVIGVMFTIRKNKEAQPNSL